MKTDLIIKKNIYTNIYTWAQFDLITKKKHWRWPAYFFSSNASIQKVVCSPVCTLFEDCKRLASDQNATVYSEMNPFNMYGCDTKSQWAQFRLQISRSIADLHIFSPQMKKWRRKDKNFATYSNAYVKSQWAQFWFYVSQSRADLHIFISFEDICWNPSRYK